MRVPTLFQRDFRGLNCEKLNFETIVDDLPREKLTTHSIFPARAKDRAVKTAEMAFFAIIFLVQCSLQTSLGENQDYQPRLIFVQLRFTESVGNNVGKLEIVF